MGIQNEVLGGQRRAREYQIRQKERLVGNPGRALTAEAPGAQPRSSEGLLKSSFRDWGFSQFDSLLSSEEDPRELKRKVTEEWWRGRVAT